MGRGWGRVSPLWDYRIIGLGRGKPLHARTHVHGSVDSPLAFTSWLNLYRYMLGLSKHHQNLAAVAWFVLRACSEIIYLRAINAKKMLHFGLTPQQCQGRLMIQTIIELQTT